MLRVLPVVLGIAVTVFGLIDCLQSDTDRVRALPKPAWLFVIIVLPILGSVAWLIAGRPRSRPPGRGGPSRPSSPDDDPDFLRKLRWEQERRRAEDEDRP